MPLCFSLVMSIRPPNFVLYLMVLLMMLSSGLAYSELYRYQDSSGKWHFTDRPPKERLKSAHSFKVKSHKSHPKPAIKRIKSNGHFVWLVDNPLPVTIQIWLRWQSEQGFFHNQLIEPGTEAAEVWRQKNKGRDFDFYYLLGKPVERPEGLVIPPPYQAGKSYQVTQGFNGRYSHSGRGSVYAVDIAMPVGSHIHAVKAGLVADARDTFTVGGAASYFLDKANHVTVMHEDGSYAVYAHILQGSLKVDTGQRIEVGQALARSGNTGFSTGPHLHFVIRYNSGRGGYSVPFRFLTPGGGGVTPRESKRYLGVDANHLKP